MLLCRSLVPSIRLAFASEKGAAAVAFNFVVATFCNSALVAELRSGALVRQMAELPVSDGTWPSREMASSSSTEGRGRARGRARGPSPRDPEPEEEAGGTSEGHGRAGDRGGAADGGGRTTNRGRRRTRRDRGGDARAESGSRPEKGHGRGEGKGKKGKSKGKDKGKSKSKSKDKDKGKDKGPEKGQKGPKGQGKNPVVQPEEIQRMIQEAVHTAMSSIGSATAYTLKPGWYQATTGIWWRWDGIRWSQAPAEDPADRESSVRSVVRERISPPRPDPVVLREAPRPRPVERPVEERPTERPAVGSKTEQVERPRAARGSEKPPEPARPPRTAEGEAPQKKSRAAPPPGGPPSSSPDWGDGSEYSYDYITEEEGPPSGGGGGNEGEGREQAERPTVDPTVSVSTRGQREVPERRPRDERARNEGPREPARREREAPRPDPIPEGRRARPVDTVSDVSTARTEELREMLGSRGKGEGDRNKPSLSQVRIEPFKGSRSHYKEWKRTLEAQRSLYRLEDGELAMLIYLSCQGEPRAILSQMEVSEMREPGGLQRVLRLLDESFGARSDERFEANQDAYLSFRRHPGMSIAEYISTLKRLRNEYLREDEGTVISDKSFAQRLLSRAALTRRERMDIFFSAGGRYASAALERVMRFRCAAVHTDEKKGAPERSGGRREDRHPYGRKKQFQGYRKSDRSRPSKPSRYQQAHVADQDEPNESEEEEDHGATDEEDLEQEQEAYAASQGSWEGEGHEEWQEQEDDFESAGSLAEAYAAGWKAKSKSAEQRKARGWKQKGGEKGGKGKGKGKRRNENRPIDERKKTSKCSSCQQRGHWHGDPTCPNVINGTDPPREQGSQANYNATEGSPASSGGPKTHRVNWTFMVNNDSWELLRGYYSEEEESQDTSSDEDQSPDPVLLAAPKNDKPRSSKDRQRRYKVALKTVLEALAAEEEDDAVKKKLKKKEHRSAREEEARQKKGKTPSGPSPMETDMSPHEILQILPYMSTVEKKELYRALKKEQEAEALKYMDPEANAEKMKRVEGRTKGYSAGRPGVPKYTQGAARSSKEVEPAAPASKQQSELPEPVRRRRLDEFRRTLFENSLDKKGRVRPSEAADFPDASQERCEHPYEELRWGANGSAHWAHCRKCKLKRVLYYSNEHGAMVADEQGALFADEPSQVILDTGCRTAVAGEKWHLRFREELKRCGLGWEEVPHHEIFRFGAGAPVVSRKAAIYPVVLGSTGELSWLRLAVVSNTSTDNRVDQCPALVGPSELARWRINFNFAEGQLTIGDKSMVMTLSETRHPVLPVCEAGHSMAEWDGPELQHLRQRLIHDPFSLALMAAALPEEGEESLEEESPEKILEEQDDEMDMTLARWQEELEAQAISGLDGVLARVPVEALTTSTGPMSSIGREHQ